MGEEIKSFGDLKEATQAAARSRRLTATPATTRVSYHGEIRSMSVSAVSPSGRTNSSDERSSSVGKTTICSHFHPSPDGMDRASVWGSAACHSCRFRGRTRLVLAGLGGFESRHRGVSSLRSGAEYSSRSSTRPRPIGSRLRGLGFAAGRPPRCTDADSTGRADSPESKPSYCPEPRCHRRLRPGLGTGAPRRSFGYRW